MRRASIATMILLVATINGIGQTADAANETDKPVDPDIAKRWQEPHDQALVQEQQKLTAAQQEAFNTFLPTLPQGVTSGFERKGDLSVHSTAAAYEALRELSRDFARNVAGGATKRENCRVLKGKERSACDCRNATTDEKPTKAYTALWLHGQREAKAMEQLPILTGHLKTLVCRLAIEAQVTQPECQATAGGPSPAAFFAMSPALIAPLGDPSTGRIHVQSAAGRIYGFDAATGQILASPALDTPIQAFALSPVAGSTGIPEPSVALTSTGGIIGIALWQAYRSRRRSRFLTRTVQAGRRDRPALWMLGFAMLAMPLASQQVRVYEPDAPARGTTPTNLGLSKAGLNQRVLAIPVVTQDNVFNPNANLVSSFSATAAGNVTTAIDTASQFWQENSYGRVSLQPTVLDRYFQMPRGKDFYYHPDYAQPVIEGTEIFAAPVTVPAGRLRLILRISASDQTVLNVDFNAGDSPYTYAALEARIQAQISSVGDKLAFQLQPSGASRRLLFTVGQRYVEAGTFVHVDAVASASSVLDALGLTRPDKNLPSLTAISREAKFPLTTVAGQTVTVTLRNQAGAVQSTTWTMTSASFTNPGTFVAVHGASNPNFSWTASGTQLRTTITSTIGGTASAIEVTSSDAQLLDNLGFSEVVERVGVVTFSGRNTLKGSWSGIAGQAVAAFILNGAIRPHGVAPNDPIPNLPITAANQPALTAAVNGFFSQFRAVVIVFLDAPNGKRAGASANYFTAGIDNGGYTFEYQLYRPFQIDYDYTPPNVYTHEFGHNFGFWDFYNNSNGEYDPNLRFPGSWDIMDNSSLNHTSYWHKELIAGWMGANGAVIATQPEAAAFGVPETKRYVLTPLEYPVGTYDNALPATPPGRQRAKAIRLPIGLAESGNDHFLVLENRQRGASFSLSLPQAAGVPASGGLYVYDAISPQSFSFFAPTTRNVVHPLTDRPLLFDGNVSPVTDTVPPPGPDINIRAAYPAYAGITVDIAGSIPGPSGQPPSLLVDVTREQKEYLELMIGPWGNPPWESPDIWIEHGDQPLSAVPLPGNGRAYRAQDPYDPAANGGRPLNFIRVRVTNAGTVDATKVQVQVKINTPSGIGDAGSWAALPLSTPLDIPHGQSRIFDIPWNPKTQGHTCIQAEVFRWTSVLGDRNPWNNRTQENLSDVYVTSSSPWVPVPFEFEVSNGKRFELPVTLQVERLSPGLIVSLDQTALTIPARGKVRVTGRLSIDESVMPTLNPADPNLVAAVKRLCGGGTLNTVLVPLPGPCFFDLVGYTVGEEYRVPIGGVSFRVFLTAKVRVGATVNGDGGGRIVVRGSTEPAAPNERLEIHVVYPSGRQEFLPVTTDGSGGFSHIFTPAEPGNVSVDVRYPSGQVFAPSQSGAATIDPAKHGPGGSVRGLRRDVSFFLGGFMASGKTRLDSGVQTGFRFAQYLTARWAAEFETGVAPSGYGGSKGLLVHGQGQVLYHLGGTGSTVRPFLLVGAGVQDLHLRGSNSQTPRTSFGGGLKFHWIPRVGFRLDFRQVRLHNLQGLGASRNYEVQWGAMFSF